MASNKTTSSIIYSFFKKVPLDEKYLNKENSKKYSSWQCLKSTCLKIITYVDHVSNLNIEDTLLFWKENEFKYPELSILAKKFLGVPASEADVERCFNISGFIHNP